MLFFYFVVLLFHLFFICIWIGYSLSYRHGVSDWQTIFLEADRRTYTLTKLLCGTKYELFLKAKNAVGESKPSPFVYTGTKGQGKF